MNTSIENRPPQARERLLRIPEVESITGVKKSLIYSLMKRGDFPASIKLGGRCVAWQESSVQAWVQQRIEESSPDIGYPKDLRRTQ